MRRLFERLQSFVAHPLRRAWIVVSSTAFLTLFVALPAFAAGDPTTPGSLSFGDHILLIFAGIFSAAANVMMKITLALFDVAIDVMSYNGFVSSPVVSAGWTVVRDTVNMFFVVVLIAIAFGTIIGYQKFQWEKQIPRLMIFAIVINFSKTLCGIMIDVGQVVMLTFANAIQSVAAGNFINLFAINLQQFTALSDQAGAAANGAAQSGIQPFDFFAGGLAGLVMTLWILATTIVIVAILFMRIVMLWVLIVISPLAWFIGGTSGLTKSHAYEDWWAKFVCYVAVGPVLVFFLWLTFSVAAAGSIAASKGFNPQTIFSPVASGLPLKIFEPANLISFLIAMALLYAGFEAAASVCAGASGAVNGVLAAGKKNPLARVAGGYLQGLGARGLNIGKDSAISAGKNVGGRVAGSELVQGTALARFTEQGKARNDIAKASDLRKKAAAAGASGDAHKQQDLLVKASGLEKGAAAAALKPAEGTKDLDTESKLGVMNTLLEESHHGKLNTSGKQQLEAMYAQALGDDKLMKGLDSSGNLKELHQQFGKQIKSTFKGDKAVLDNLKTFEGKRPDVTGDFSGVTDLESLRKIDPKALAAISSDPKLKDKFEAQTADIDSGDTWRDDGVDADGNAVKKGDPIKLLQYLKAGRMGGRSREAYQNGLGTYYAKMPPDALGKENLENMAAVLSPEIIGKSEKVAQNVLKSDLPTVKTALQNPANYAAAMKGIGIGADGGIALNAEGRPSDTFKDFIKANPLALQNIDTATLKPEAITAVGQSLGEPQLEQLMAEYKTAVGEKRDQLKQALNRAEEALAQSGGSVAEVGNDRLEYLQNERKRVDERVAASAGASSASSSGIGGLEGDLEQMTTETGRLAAQSQELQTKLDELDRVMRINGPTPEVAGNRASVSAQLKEINTTREVIEQQLRTLRPLVDEARNAKAVAEAEARSNNAEG